MWQWEITPSPSIDERVHGREVEERVCVCARLLWQHVNVVRVSINRNSRLWSARDCVTVPRRRVRQSVWCPCWYLCLVAASKRCGEMNVKPGVDYSASFSGLTLRSLRVNAPLSPGLPRFSAVFAIPRGLFGRYIHVRSASVMQYWSMMRSAGWNYSCLNSFHSHSDARSLNCFSPQRLTGCCFCLLPHFVEITHRVSKWC